MDDGPDESNNEIAKLVSRFKSLKKVICQKQSFEYILEQLTLCNNIATLSKDFNLFYSKVLRVFVKVICNSIGPHSEAIQTLVVSIENVSEKFQLDNKNWKLHFELNGKTRGVWELKSPLCPGNMDKFCVPLTNHNFQFPLMTVKVCMQFSIDFESQTYTKSFDVSECTLDILDCLDAEKYATQSGIHESFRDSSFVDVSEQVHQTKVEFPPITKFILRLDPTLKEIFVRSILLCDCLHRGFESQIEDLSKQNELSVFYLGIQIDVNLSKSDIVMIECANPSVLCAVKASILRRLVTVEGITVEPLSDRDKERLDSLDLKLQTLTFDETHGANRVRADDLMELYLKLREIGESIHFSVAHVLE